MKRGVCKNGGLIWSDICKPDEVCEIRDSFRACYTIEDDCEGVYKAGFRSSGVYTISPRNWPGSPFKIYCTMTGSGGWTVSTFCTFSKTHTWVTIQSYPCSSLSDV